MKKLISLSILLSLATSCSDGIIDTSTTTTSSSSTATAPTIKEVESQIDFKKDGPQTITLNGKDYIVTVTDSQIQSITDSNLNPVTLQETPQTELSSLTISSSNLSTKAYSSSTNNILSSSTTSSSSESSLLKTITQMVDLKKDDIQFVLIDATLYSVKVTNGMVSTFEKVNLPDSSSSIYSSSYSSSSIYNSSSSTVNSARVLDDLSKNAAGRDGGSNHDNTGLWGAEDDVLKGGTTQVLSGDGANNLRGSCAVDVDGCLYDGWKFFDQAGGAFDGSALNAIFNITDWTPQTPNGADGTTGWGAGADATLTYFWKTGTPDKNGTPKEFDVISKNDVLCIDMEYTNVDRGTTGNPDLRIALREENFDWGIDKGRPFYSQDGIRSGLKGILGAARKTWKLPIHNFRRPKWISDAGISAPVRYSINGFDIIRLESPFEEAEAKAPVAFPTNKYGKTRLKIYKVSLNDC